VRGGDAGSRLCVTKNNLGTTLRKKTSVGRGQWREKAEIVITKRGREKACARSAPIRLGGAVWVTSKKKGKSIPGGKESAIISERFGKFQVISRGMGRGRIRKPNFALFFSNPGEKKEEPLKTFEGIPPMGEMGQKIPDHPCSELPKIPR